MSQKHTKVRSTRQIRANKSTSKLKKELDKYFSLWVRSINPPVCYTCGAFGKTLQCGHFVSRQYLATRWEPDNCRPQCVGCNIWGNGKPLDFEEHLERDLGADRVKQLKQSRHKVLKLSNSWYEEEIKKYKDLLHSKKI